MAGDWIKMRGNLWDDPRVSALVDATDSSEAVIIGGLYWLWSTADQHTEDGFLPGLTLRQIDRKTGIKGLASALVSILWLSEEADGVVVSKFTEHNGQSAKRRCSDAQRKAGVRSLSALDADIPETDIGQKAPVCGAREREEKRREEEEGIPVAKATLSPEAPAPIPNCPHIALIDLYGKHLPTLPQPQPEAWDGSRAEAMRARWRWVMTAKRRSGERYASTAEEALAWFDRYFAYAAESDFLTGRSGKWTSCDLGWLVNATNFNKVVKGNYVNKTDATKAQEPQQINRQEALEQRNRKVALAWAEQGSPS